MPLLSRRSRKTQSLVAPTLELDISDAFDAAAPKIPTNEDLLFFL
jgi:hypothetical protein